MAQQEAITPRAALTLYSWSVMPALIAWAALLMPEIWRHGYGALFCGLLAY